MLCQPIPNVDIARAGSDPNIVSLQKLPALLNIRLVKGSVAHLMRRIDDVAVSN